jgi:hypothetical protein
MKYLSESLISGERVEWQNRHSSGVSSVQGNDFMRIEERVESIPLNFNIMGQKITFLPFLRYSSRIPQVFLIPKD